VYILKRVPLSVEYIHRCMPTAEHICYASSIPLCSVSAHSLDKAGETSRAGTIEFEYSKCTDYFCLWPHRENPLVSSITAKAHSVCG
jgi:hypothetical protein